MCDDDSGVEATETQTTRKRRCGASSEKKRRERKTSPAAKTRHCFITEVKEGKIDEYINFHDNIWPEVCAGLRAAGLVSLHIYRVPGSRTLVLNIETAGPIDLAKATGPGSKYRENAHCKEWEEMMDADFHGGWTELSEVHSSEKQWNSALQLPMQ